VTVAVWDTGFASTSSTPGRRDNTASATFFEAAQCTPDTSSTAVRLAVAIRTSNKDAAQPLEPVSRGPLPTVGQPIHNAPQLYTPRGFTLAGECRLARARLLLTGLVMSLGTPPRLLRHYWLLIALLPTALALAVLLLHCPL